MVIDLDFRRSNRLREQPAKTGRFTDRLAYSRHTKLEPPMKYLLRVLLFASLLLPLMANAASQSHSVGLAPYTPPDAIWHLNCAVGDGVKTEVGSALVTQRIEFDLGSPGDDIKCVVKTTKGVDASPVSQEYTKHIPFPLAAPAILTWDLLP
jgi:hypothetical protein